VLAIDIDSDALTQLTTRFASTRRTSSAARLANDPRLDGGTLDGVLLVDAFHELTDPAATLAPCDALSTPAGGSSSSIAPRRSSSPARTQIPEAARRGRDGGGGGFHLARRAICSGSSRSVFE